MFVACDESGINASEKYLVIGSAWTTKQGVCDFERKITELRLEKKCWGEVEWLKVGTMSDKMCQFYKDFLEQAFKEIPIYLHFIVVEKALLDIGRYHQKSNELVRFKFMYLLLSRHGERYLQKQDRVGLHVIFDRFIQSKKAQNEQWTLKMRRHIESHLNSPIEHLQPCTSHICSLVQLCDLFTGAISTSWNMPTSRVSPRKQELIDFIERKVGKTLKARTLPTERDFNIWVWRPRVS